MGASLIWGLPALPEGGYRRPVHTLTDDGPPPERAGVVIVGGGFAGLEVARRLADHGCLDVVVLEGGPAAELRHTNVTHDPDAAVELWLDPTRDPYHRRPWTSARAPHFQGNAGVRARLGGRSLYWYGVTLPMDAWALAGPGWPTAVVHDLTTSWRGGPGLYERQATELGLSWLDGTVAAPGAARQLGGFTLRPTPRAVRPHPDQAGRWSAYSPLDHWRDPATGAATDPAPRVRIFADTRVRRVCQTGGRATGVIAVDGRTTAPHRIAADAVVLAAGTVENSRLAIQALTTAGALAVPKLGGLADHLVQGFLVRIATAGRLPLRPGSYYLQFPATRSILFLSLWRVSRSEAVLDVKINGECPPSGESYVACQPQPAYPWPTVVYAGLSGEGRRVLAAQRTVLDDVWAALAVAFGLAGQLTFGPYDDPPSTNVAVLPRNRDRHPLGVPQTWSSPLGAEDHEGGTLPLGSVLSENHEFRHLPGLYAAGPATFPRIGAANPSLTTMALARRLAAVLADRLPASAGTTSGAPG